MSSWEQLDSFLEQLAGQIGGQAYLFAENSKLTLSPPNEIPDELLVRFERAFSGLVDVLGKEPIRRGSWRRHLNHEEGNWFVAEPILGSYHLIVLFESDYTSDEWISHRLEKARPAIEAIITGLPPIDGGRRANEMKMSS